MRSKFSAVLKAGLLVGTADILAAFLYFFLKTGNLNVGIVLHYISGGLFGKAAFSGGRVMAVTGLLLHYAFAFGFTLFWFWVFPVVSRFSRSRVVLGIVYGLLVWTIMNLLVVPLSRIGKRPLDTTDALINIGILIACIGIPLAFRAASFYKKRGGAST